jgi:glycosyltransferase involved in cell wall biosynthesis
VLLIAPTCDRDDVGEAWVAYQWVSRLAAVHQLTVLTYYKRGRQPPSQQLPGVRVIEWREPPLLGRAERLNSMLKPAYVPFAVHAGRWIKTALRAGEQFDIAHQPAPVAMRYPSPLARSGLPYVIGPVGGSLASPPGFAEADTAPWFVNLRKIDAMRLRRDRWLRRTYSNAGCVIGIAPYVKDLLQSVPLQRFEVVSDTGIESLPPAIERQEHDVVRLLFVGRLVRTKGARDAILAMDLLRDLPVHLDVVGEGYDQAACAGAITSLGLQDRVTLHGRVPRERVDEFYRKADVFIFPSYREAGGTVVSEAMGFGLPMVVSNRGGPAAAVDDSCGYRVEPVNPEQYAHDLALAARRLVVDPALRRRMGLAARERVMAVRSWPSMVDRVSEIYADVIRENTASRSRMT